jgi:hypothetical protein
MNKTRARMVVGVVFLCTSMLMAAVASAQTCTGQRLRFYNIIGWSEGWTQYYGPWVYYENEPRRTIHP